MKAVVAAFNQEKALVGAFSVIKNLRMELFQALLSTAADSIQIHYDGEFTTLSNLAYFTRRKEDGDNLLWQQTETMQ